MKHILILLSILLLSSPVIGEETGVLYYWKRSSGDVWKTFGDDNTHPKYVGEIKNDKPNGLGILYNGSPNYDGTFDFYIWKGIKFVGSWKNGKPHGEGIFDWGDSDTVGEWRDGKEWNTISREYKNGYVFEKWVNGKLVCRRPNCKQPTNPRIIPVIPQD